jgi:hypothetical protein
MSYPTFHEFCGVPEKSNLTVSGANGDDLPPGELRDLVGMLNNQPDVDRVAKVIALHSSHRGHASDVNSAWDVLPEDTKDLWRGTATKLLTTFFIRLPLPPG